MILTHFCNDLPRPYFLINEFLSIINTNNEIDRSAENDGFLLWNKKIEEEWIFVIGIKTKRKFSMLNSFYSFRIHVYFVDAELKLICWINHHHPDIFHFKQLVIFKCDGSTNIEYWRWWLHPIYNALLYFV